MSCDLSVKTEKTIKDFRIMVKDLKPAVHFFYEGNYHGPSYMRVELKKGAEIPYDKERATAIVNLLNGEVTFIDSTTEVIREISMAQLFE